MNITAEQMPAEYLMSKKFTFVRMVIMKFLKTNRGKAIRIF